MDPSETGKSPDMGTIRVAAAGDVHADASRKADLEAAFLNVRGETGREVAALEEGLSATADCDFRIVLLHYAPSLMTLEGERPEIAAFLGCDRLAHPIAEHCPDLVLHGHAHAGRFDGTIRSVPVFNVALPMKREFWVFELSDDRPRAPEYALVG